MTNDQLAGAIAVLLASPPRIAPADMIALRLKAGLTQQRLAVRMGVAIRTVQHWEAGTRKPPESAVIVLTLLAWMR